MGLCVGAFSFGRLGSNPSTSTVCVEQLFQSALGLMAPIQLFRNFDRIMEA